MGMHEGLIKVARLRVRGASGDSLATRLRMERLMGAVSPGALGLPPSAILCVRRLEDLQPGGTPRQRHASSSPVEWERMLGSALRARLSRAARPSEGAVPAGSEAVLFSDLAELLGCLALALGQGLHVHQWWWSGLYGGTDLRVVLLREWSRKPEYLPASLGLLARRGEVAPALAVLDEAEARGLLTALVLRHGQRELLVEARSSPAAGEDTAVARTEHGEHAVGRKVRDGGPSSTEASALWERWVPEVRAVETGLERRTLLGVSLMLHRAPVELRRPGFAPALHAWRREQARRSDERPPPPRPPEVRASAASQPTFAHAPGTVEAPSNAAEWEAPRASSKPVREEAQARQDTEAIPEAGPVPRSESPVPGAPSADAVSPSESPARSGPGVSGPPVEPPPPPPPPVTQGAFPRAARESPPERAWGLPVPTGLGGLFYLVNLGLFLELYGDFSRPMHPHLPLPVWDFVTLLGRGLLVDSRPSDPVWKVLALLSGRKPGEAPGQAFEPPDAWRIPEDWLLAFRASDAFPWTWEARDGRLRVRHPMGFLVVDVPCAPGASGSGEEAEAQALRELERLARVASPTRGQDGMPLLHGEVAGPEGTPLERWLGWLVPYCRARLARALGLPPDDALALETTLLTHDARLHVTDTHVDVVLALSQLPLEVRVAGLDRDIGWLPSAGRHLSFHFE